MYEHSHYKRLCHLVDDAIAQRKLEPESIKDMKIDELLPDESLKGIDEMVVVLVAAEKGFLYFQCDYGPECKTHDHPKIRANGVWVDVPPVLEDAIAQYSNQKSVDLCPVCEQKYSTMFTEQKKRYQAYKLAVENRIQIH
jgi:hypothetical protein